jgi:hypothetical protein
MVRIHVKGTSCGVGVHELETGSAVINSQLGAVAKQQTRYRTHLSYRNGKGQFDLTQIKTFFNGSNTTHNHFHLPKYIYRKGLINSFG